jgi:SHS2 domain-containing protein
VSMPYRFLEDIATADVAFEAWGKTREGLFTASAAALLRTMVEVPEAVERRQEQLLRLEHEELDLLLFSFLQEIVFLKDARRLLLHVDSSSITEGCGLYRLEATLRGEEIDPRRHSFIVDVKAVTLHLFRVFFEDGNWKAVIVLDV